MSKGKYRRKRDNAKKKPEQATLSAVIVGDGKPNENKIATGPESTKNAGTKVQPSRWSPVWEYMRGPLFANQAVAAFTLVLAFCAMYQFIVMSGQLDSMRKDERAWVSVNAAATPRFVNDTVGNVTVFWDAVATNTGKSPARHFAVEVVVDKVRNGVYPAFPYNRTVTLSTAGLILPNGNVPIQALLGEPMTVNGQQVPIPLSPSEYQDILDGKDFLIVYGHSTYVDIFGKKHWQHFCGWSSPTTKAVQVTASTCSNYNDVDDN